MRLDLFISLTLGVLFMLNLRSFYRLTRLRKKAKINSSSCYNTFISEYSNNIEINNLMLKIYKLMYVNWFITLREISNVIFMLLSLAGFVACLVIYYSEYGVFLKFYV